MELTEKEQQRFDELQKIARDFPKSLFEYIKNEYYDFQQHQYPIELQKQVEKYNAKNNPAKKKKS